MTTLYQINNWDQNYENFKSRKVNHCSFVCVPNKQDGMGFTTLMSLPDGASIYGIWHMLLGACSKHPWPREGWLTEGGIREGIPWYPLGIATRFRRTKLEIERAFEALTSLEVGWIQAYDSEEDENGIPLVSARYPIGILEQNRTEHREREREVAPKSKKFVPPTVEDCTKYGKEISLPDKQSEHFFHYNVASGWLVGSKPMKCWKSAMQTWKIKGPKFENRKTGNSQSSKNAGVYGEHNIHDYDSAVIRGK